VGLIVIIIIKLREGKARGVGISSHLQEISNPRVLSDMGLAIPRPTRLGDPRSKLVSDSEIILKLLTLYPKGHVGSKLALQPSRSDAATLLLPLPQHFEEYLKAQKKRNVRQIICYARKYSAVLETGDATALMNLSSGAVRRHAMEALTALSKYLGLYDRWQQIHKRYSLKWTSGDESVKSLERFFNPNLTLDNICALIGQMIAKTPLQIANIIRFACLTGLRPREVIESVKLINRQETLGTYYNQDRKHLNTLDFLISFYVIPRKHTSLL
jgi:hypothetical protein